MEEENKPQRLEYASPSAKRSELPIEHITRVLFVVVCVMYLLSSVVFVGVAGGMGLVGSALACWQAARRAALPIAPVACWRGRLGC